MVQTIDPERKIAYTKALIARTEERLRKLQARAKPGDARMVHALTNNVRRYRRDLHKLLAREADHQNVQLSKQQVQMQQAQRHAPDRTPELPERQDQEPRKPASKQGVVAGQ